MPGYQSQSAACRIVVIQDFIAIVERLRTLSHGCHRDLGKFANPLKGVLYLRGFIRQLARIRQVLQVTAATAVVQGTGGRDAPG